MKLKYRKSIRMLVAAAIFAAACVLLTALKNSSFLCENVFARGISKAWVYFFGTLSSFFPFSLYDLFIAVTVVFVAATLFIIISSAKKRRSDRLVKALASLVLYVACFAFIYNFTAGMNYYREELPLPFYEGEALSEDELREAIVYFNDDFSEISEKADYEDGKIVMPYTEKELYDLLRKEYEKLPSYYSDFFVAPKKTLFSPIFSATGISGLTFLPTGETLLNAQNMQCSSLIAAAHETAHLKGVMRENDAVLTAVYVLISSENEYFRYCGYMYYLPQMYNLYYSLYGTDEPLPSFPEKAWAERQKEAAFWAEKESFVTDIGSYFNDLYIKLNGGSGTSDYSDPNLGHTAPDGSPVVVYNNTQKLFLSVYFSKNLSL